MLELFKDGAEAWFQRIRSPIIGSVLLSFVIINWKVLFFLAFAQAPIIDRFDYFDENSSVVTLLFGPIGLGVLIGLATPFINYFGSRCAKWPTEKLRLLQAESASAVLARRAELATNRELDAARFKEAALENARVSQAISDASLDDATRLALESKLAEDSEIVDPALNDSKISLSELEKAIVLFIGKEAGKGLRFERSWRDAVEQNESLIHFYHQFPSVRLDVDSKAALDRLNSSKIARVVRSRNGAEEWQLTEKGYRVYDSLIG